MLNPLETLIILIFLSTLSLRRATIVMAVLLMFSLYFYPRSPCGERLGGGNTMNIDVTISIHALLAESDYSMGRNEKSFRGYFYPRSPCGERLRGWTLNINGPIFLSTLSLRRATPTQQRKTKTNEFLSTLSLRRATGLSQVTVNAVSNFYPRSPCGERRRWLPL